MEVVNVMKENVGSYCEHNNEEHNRNLKLLRGQGGNVLRSTEYCLFCIGFHGHAGIAANPQILFNFLRQAIPES